MYNTYTDIVNTKLISIVLKKKQCFFILYNFISNTVLGRQSAFINSTIIFIFIENRKYRIIIILYDNSAMCLVPV